MSKKILSNGRSTELAKFLLGQVSPTEMKAFEVLLDLTYPIADRTSFCEQIDRVEVESHIKEMLKNIFTPRDFGLDSAQNALEKFRLNLNTIANQVNSIQGVGTPVFGTPIGGGSNPNPGIGTTIPTTVGVGVNPVGINPVTNVWSTTPNVQVGQVWNQGNWQFGNDVCGEAAACLFCDMVIRGINPAVAYNICHEREVFCRANMPHYGNTPNARIACCVFAQHCIVLGRSIVQCDQAARFCLNNCNCTPTMGTTTQVNTTTGQVTRVNPVSEMVGVPN